MRNSRWLAVLFLLTFCMRTAPAQKVEATVLYRQNSDTSYSAVIPRPDGSKPEGTVDCAADNTNEACSDPSRGVAPGQPSLSVTGTTVSLLLPDGRVAVVNCLNKYSYKGTAINRRSCGMPMVQQVEADLNGNSARLKWSEGPDSIKSESEKYRIVALLARP
jgi:hypothetical protein